MSERLDIASFPRMVKWFTPAILATTAARHMISSVFGQFADQRIMQATVDGISTSAVKSLVLRHDYSAKTDNHGEFWIDYVADLGDGFDSTYAVASLISADHLEVPGAGRLPGGRVLIMGGDQVYPFPTRAAYKERMARPYAMAMPATSSGGTRRDLFALPGNHDWYDGLNAFDDAFCKSRYRDADENRIGGWRCRQHRSYFALKLPHNWWVWGADIQLAQHLDAGQVIYFDAVAEQMKLNPTESAKVILCIAEPSWTCADTKGVGNLDSIMASATNAGARICAVIAGDSHHYSRYRSPDRGTSFITSGGGGAYTAPTHQLKDEIELNVNGAKEVLVLGCAERNGEATNEPACFPSRGASRRLSVALLLFPFRNYSFAVGLGFVYWIMTWLFATSRGFHGETINKYIFDKTNESKSWFWWLGDGGVFFLKSFMTGIGDVTVGLPALVLLGVLYAYCDVKRTALRVIVAFLHFMAHIVTMTGLLVFWAQVNIPNVDRVFNLPIINFAFTKLDEALGGVIGKDHVQSAVDTHAYIKYELVHALLYPFEIILIGGIVGGIIWGAYFSICCYFGAHSDQAFASLRLTTYKNFLRMKLGPDQLTIFPIGLRTTPSRGAWREAAPAADGIVRGPALVSSTAMRPELIEGPIVIKATDVYCKDPTAPVGPGSSSA